jgi:hypothetical protein
VRRSCPHLRRLQLASPAKRAASSHHHRRNAARSRSRMMSVRRSAEPRASSAWWPGPRSRVGRASSRTVPNHQSGAPPRGSRQEAQSTGSRRFLGRSAPDGTGRKASFVAALVGERADEEQRHVDHAEPPQNRPASRKSQARRPLPAPGRQCCQRAPCAWHDVDIAIGKAFTSTDCPCTASCRRTGLAPARPIGQIS